jgi:hypothetical protein
LRGKIGLDPVRGYLVLSGVATPTTSALTAIISAAIARRGYGMAFRHGVVVAQETLRYVLLTNSARRWTFFFGARAAGLSQQSFGELVHDLHYARRPLARSEVGCRDLGRGGRILIKDRLQNQTMVVVRFANVTHRIE